MMENQNKNTPVIPNKRYFTIGEVSKICDVKAHVLRYWEQEFAELDPIKRKGNRILSSEDNLIKQLKFSKLAQIKSWKPTSGRFPAIIIATVLLEQSFIWYLLIQEDRFLLVSSLLQLFRDNRMFSSVNQLLYW